MKPTAVLDPGRCLDDLIAALGEEAVRNSVAAQRH
jgi:hypothetical protein